MIRKSKLYSKPMKSFESSRISSENELVKKYGLKNKREIWKALAKISYFRKRAMNLSSKGNIEDLNSFFEKLRVMGLNVKTTADVLDLKDEDLLKRRLPTILLNKKMANTPKHARQMVVHKKILINEKIVDAPGYLVNVNEESEIRLKEKTRKITNKESKESEEGKAAENKNVKSDEKVIEADSVIQTEPDKNEFKEEKS